MLGVLGFAAVVTNAVMVAFVGSEMTSVLGIYVYANGTQCKELSEHQGHGGCGLGTFYHRLEHWGLWWRFVLIEHVVMCTRVMIMSVSPTNPDWVRDAQETLNYRRNNVFLTKDEIEHHADQVKKYNRIMDVKKPIKKSAKALIRLASGLGIGHKGKVS